MKRFLLFLLSIEFVVAAAPDCQSKTATVTCSNSGRVNAHFSILMTLKKSTPVKELWVVWGLNKATGVYSGAELYPNADWEQRGDYLVIHPDRGQKDPSLWKKDAHFHGEDEQFRAVQ